jgi:hypothetical protein
VLAVVAVRGARLLVRGGVRALLAREAREGPAKELSALEIRRFYGAHVYGPGGGRLASFGAGLPDEPPQRLAELAETGDRVGEYGETAGRRVYSYFVPLVDTWGQTLGILQITRRRRDIDESIQRLRFRTGSLFLLGMALVTVLVLRGHHRAVGGPLDGLRASMARVREGDRTHRATMAGPRELAEVTGTPRPYAAHVLADLVRAGLVTSVAGRAGGYALGREPRDISMRDVGEAVGAGTWARRGVLTGRQSRRLRRSRRQRKDCSLRTG